MAQASPARLNVPADAARTRMVIPATLEAAEAAITRLRGQWASLGLSQSERFPLEIALREAVLNAVTHGSGKNPAREVTLEVALAPDGAEVTITDQGGGFNWRAALARSASPPDPACETGRGLCILHHYASTVRFNETGNVLTFTLSWTRGAPMHPTVIAAGQSLVAANAQAFKETCLKALAEQPDALTIDCSALEQLDSVGIGVLIQAHNTLARSGGVLTLTGVLPDVASLLRAMRLDKHFHVNP